MDRVNATLPPICFTASSAFLADVSGGWFALPFLALAGMGAVDTWFRWHEYVRLRDWFGDQKHISYGQFKRVLSRHKGSWCRRRLAVHASRVMDPYREDNVEDLARRHFRVLGYRWWHMLPDGFPAAFFTASWWRGLVGRKIS